MFQGEPDRSFLGALKVMNISKEINVPIDLG
jgi:hypothetical protein